MNKYPECENCYYRDREPTICDACVDASEFEPAELDVLRELEDIPWESAA